MSSFDLAIKVNMVALSCLQSV